MPTSYSGDYGMGNIASGITRGFEQMQREERYNDELVQKALMTGNMSQEEYLKYKKSGHKQKQLIAGGLAANFADEYREQQRLQNAQAQSAIDVNKANILGQERDYALKIRQFNQALAERQAGVSPASQEQARWTGHELIDVGPGRAPVLAEYPKSTSIGAPITEIPQVTETSVIDAMGVKKTFEKKKDLPIAVTRIPGTDKFHVTDLKGAAQTPSGPPTIHKTKEGYEFFYDEDNKPHLVDPFATMYARTGATAEGEPQAAPPPGVPSGVPAAAAGIFGGGQSREAMRPQVDWQQILGLFGLGGGAAPAAPAAPTAPTRAPVRVKSVEEARKLPPGTIFIDPNGVTRRR